MPKATWGTAVGVLLSPAITAQVKSASRPKSNLGKASIVVGRDATTASLRLDSGGADVGLRWSAYQIRPRGERLSASLIGLWTRLLGVGRAEERAALRRIRGPATGTGLAPVEVIEVHRPVRLRPALQ